MNFIRLNIYCYVSSCANFAIVMIGYLKKTKYLQEINESFMAKCQHVYCCFISFPWINDNLPSSRTLIVFDNPLKSQKRALSISSFACDNEIFYTKILLDVSTKSNWIFLQSPSRDIKIVVKYFFNVNFQAKCTFSKLKLLFFFLCIMWER